MAMNLGLADRVVIVTGGSRGIGRAAALAFAAERARVVITYRADRARAETVVGELRAAGAEAAAVRFDLAARAPLSAATAALERWGRIDALVNNAVDWGEASSWEQRFEEVDRDRWRSMIEANLEGHVAAIQSVLPAMRARSYGRIVNLSSTIAADGMSGSGPYAAAKGALHGLTRTLAVELAPGGILTNAVMPGLTLTETNLERLPEEARAEAARAEPIGRLLTPEEVVPIVVFLASAANTAVNGQIVRASGG
jgi:NAD(P)-dependent dehydrogenase (short-subunit alcohol dehydrogenase family)